MTHEMDDLLGRLRDVPGEPRLAGLDDAVLARLAERRVGAAASGRALALVAVLALGVGLATGVTGPWAHPSANEWGDPLGGVPAMAPSALLMGGR